MAALLLIFTVLSISVLFASLANDYENNWQKQYLALDHNAICWKYHPQMSLQPYLCLHNWTEPVYNLSNVAYINSIKGKFLDQDIML